MDNNYSEHLLDDIMETNNNWEDIPVSSLLTKENNLQICYIALTKKDALKALNNHQFNLPLNAYEYKSNIPFQEREDKVILQVMLDMNNIFDELNSDDYKEMISSQLMNKKLQRKDIMRHLEYNNKTHQFKVILTIYTAKAIKDIVKI